MNRQDTHIHIVGGSGKMGQWFASFFRERTITVTTSGRILQKQQLKKADIVIIAVPISQTKQVIEDVIPLLSQTCLLTDITSVKTMPLEAMKQAPCASLGMHPLFGPNTPHPAGQKIVFCHQTDNHHVKFLKEIFTSAQIEIITMEAKTHDRQMAYIQCLTHAINLSYAKTLFDGAPDRDQRLQTPNFGLQTLIMGRVLHQDIQLLADLQMYNPYVPAMLRSVQDNLEQLLASIDAHDDKSFASLVEKEKQHLENFSNFAVVQTNKILSLLQSIPVSLPEKQSISAPPEGSIGYLGPEGTYSHQATQILFPLTTQRKVSFESFTLLFEKLMKEEIDFIVVPIENSLEGTVRENIDHILSHPVFVLGSFDLPIHHQLLSREKNLEDIKTIYSHPQALAQCLYFLQSHVPKAKKVITSSTTAALGKTETGGGYIASRAAAQKYNIPIVAENIEDNSSNITKFYVIAKRPCNLKGLQKQKTLLFITVLNRIGILKDILEIFAKHSISLTRIESRPSREKPWDYGFFLEADIKNTHPDFKKIIKEIEQYCLTVRIIGVA